MENNQFYFFDQLSNEIKVLIIQKCDIKTVLNLSQTCKLMNEIIHDKHSNIIFKELFYSTWKIEPLEYIISNWKHTFIQAHEIFDELKSIKVKESIEKFINDKILFCKKVKFDKIFFADFAYQIGIQLIPNCSHLFGIYAKFLSKHPFSFEFKKKINFYFEKAIQIDPNNSFLKRDYGEFQLIEILKKKPENTTDIQNKFKSFYIPQIPYNIYQQSSFYFLSNQILNSYFILKVEKNSNKAFEIIKDISFLDIASADIVIDKDILFKCAKIFFAKKEYKKLFESFQRNKFFFDKIKMNFFFGWLAFKSENKEKAKTHFEQFLYNCIHLGNISIDYYIVIFKFFSKNPSLIDQKFLENISKILKTNHFSFHLFLYIEKMGLKERYRKKLESILLVEKFPNKIHEIKKFLSF